MSKILKSQLFDMTTRNRFLKMCDKKSSPPNTYQAVLFSPTNRDKTVVWALLGKVGHVLHRFLRATRAKHGASGFFTAHCFNHHPDSQRETPDKRIVNCSPSRGQRKKIE